MTKSGKDPTKDGFRDIFRSYRADSYGAERRKIKDSEGNNERDAHLARVRRSGIWRASKNIIYRYDRTTSDILGVFAGIADLILN
jgi:hypothetical protein